MAWLPGGPGADAGLDLDGLQVGRAHPAACVNPQLELAGPGDPPPDANSSSVGCAPPRAAFARSRAMHSATVRALLAPPPPRLQQPQQRCPHLGRGSQALPPDSRRRRRRRQLPLPRRASCPRLCL